MTYRNDEQFQDFIEYNDLGLPLSYAIDSEIVKSTEMAQRFIEEAFSLLLAGLDIAEDAGYETMDDILGGL
jgi:hypothetical protein